jgi:glycosyltransferase involved in cell wall biosynthesis
VDHLSGDDVGRVHPRLLQLSIEPHFSWRSFRRLREVAHQYDVIDALEAVVPWTKSQIGFEGLLVSRSLGSTAGYHAFAKWARRRWPEEPLGNRMIRPIRSARLRENLAYAALSQRHADLVALPNSGELGDLASPDIRAKAFVEPFGLTASHMAALRNAAGQGSSIPRVAFVGSWSPRKGSRDFADIIRLVWQRLPTCEFSLLGTVSDAPRVFHDLGMPPDARVRVVPTFDNAQLPRLLGDAVVSVFPSYIEGFGFAVLECLAAGLPVVAYRGPGASDDILGHIDYSLVAGRGDIAAMAARLLSLLTDVEGTRRLGERCQAAAAAYTWDAIAARNEARYRQGLAELARTREGGRHPTSL